MALVNDIDLSMIIIIKDDSMHTEKMCLMTKVLSVIQPYTE